MRVAEASRVRRKDKYILDNRSVRMNEPYMDNTSEGAYTYICTTIADEEASQVFAC